MDSHDNTKLKKREKQVASQKEEPVIFLGPYIKGLVTPGTVFNNGLPPALEEAKKKIPAIGEVLIPISRAADARKQLEQKGSAINAFYKQIENFGKE